MGVERAGFRSLLLSEVAPYACETLVANGARPYPVEGGCRPPVPQPGDKPPLLVGDVAKAEFEHLADLVDVLAGGPPCQPFSLGGVSRGNDDERNGFPHMFRAIREMRPKAVICENVRGLLRPSFAPYFEYIKRELEFPFEQRKEGVAWHEHNERLCELADKEGGRVSRERYRVMACRINAADYGVPQIRHRVIIVAFRSDLGINTEAFKKLVIPRFSQASLHRSMANGEYWDRHSNVPQQVRERVMAELPRQARMPTHEESFPWRTLRDAVEGIDGLKALPSIPAEYLDRKERFLGGFADHVGWPDARIYPGHTPNELDRPAKTVKAGVHGVAGGESVVALDNGSHRYMTVRETARVMTFPDDRVLAGPRGEKMRQLGNAVPVLLGEVFATAVATVLDQVDRRT